MCCIRVAEVVSKTVSLSYIVAYLRHPPLTGNETKSLHDASFKDHSEKLLQQILTSLMHFSFHPIPSLFGLSQLETLVDRNFVEVTNLQHHSLLTFQGTI